MRRIVKQTAKFSENDFREKDFSLNTSPDVFDDKRKREIFPREFDRRFSSRFKNTWASIASTKNMTRTPRGADRHNLNYTKENKPRSVFRDLRQGARRIPAITLTGLNLTHLSYKFKLDLYGLVCINKDS